MRAAYRFLRLVWPFFAAGLLCMKLMDAERVAHRLNALAPLRHVALLVSLEHEHEMVRGDLHVQVQHVDGGCQVHAFRSARGVHAGDVWLATACTEELAVDDRDGEIHIERAHMPMRLRSPLSVGTLLWLSFVIVVLLIARATFIWAHRDSFLRARPCVIHDGLATFVDGESPRVAACVGPSADGIAWACVRIVLHGSYRDSPYFPCEVVADRDEAITACHQDMLFVILALACIAMSWLHFVHAWVT